MEQFLSELTVKTSGQGFTDITQLINNWILNNKINQGVIILTCKHTSCSLIINENADPKVLSDLSAYLNALVPEEGFSSIARTSNDLTRYRHSDEGPDDMPAHIRTVLTCSSLSLSIDSGRLLLGTWQAIYLWEHRSCNHYRKVSLHSLGDK